MLGRDCDGKPLYAGDVVLFLPRDPSNTSHKHLVGVGGEVKGECPDNLKHPLDAPGPWVVVQFECVQGFSAAHASSLKKIRSGKQPTTTWAEIENTTGGWNPVVEQDEEVAA